MRISTLLIVIWSHSPVSTPFIRLPMENLGRDPVAQRLMGPESVVELAVVFQSPPGYRALA